MIFDQIEKITAVAVDPASRHLGVLGIQLDQDGVSLEAVGDQSSCPGAAETVQNRCWNRSWGYPFKA